MNGEKEEPMRAYLFKITISDSNPPVWRRLTVPTGVSFDELHDIFREAVGWNGYRDYRFSFDETGLEREIPSGDEARDRRVDAYVDAVMAGTGCFLYVYNFGSGDGWWHEVETEGLSEDRKENWPEVTEAEGNCPPGDCGGPEAYADFLAIRANPADPEYERVRAWGEAQFYCDYNMDEVNFTLRTLYRKSTASETDRARNSFTGYASDGGNEAGGRRESKRSLRATLGRLSKADLQKSLADNLGVDETAAQALLKYDKAELTEHLAACILDEENALACFLNGTDREIALMRICVRADQPLTPESASDILFFARRGYCFTTKDAKIAVPDEAAALFERLVTKNAGFGAMWRRYNLVCDFICAAINLYAVISPDEAADIFNGQYDEKTDAGEILEVCRILSRRDTTILIHDGLLVDDLLMDEYEEEVSDVCAGIRASQKGKPFFVPPADEFLQYADETYFEQTKENDALKAYLKRRFGVRQETANRIVSLLHYCIVYTGGETEDMMELLAVEGLSVTGAEYGRVLELLVDVVNHTRIYENRGHTPAELAEIFGRSIGKGKVVPFRKR